MASKGCIFQPQRLTWEDIDGGQGEDIAMNIDDFTANEPTFDDPERYYEGYLDFVEAWEDFTRRFDDNDYKKLYAVLSLLKGEYAVSIVYDKLMDSLLKSMTKAELLRFIVRVSTLYAWYAELVIHTKQEV